MDRTERFYKMQQLLEERRAVPLSLIMEELDVSRATVKRDLEYLRDRLNAPIVWDRELRGYRFDNPHTGAPKYALPGLWFNASEVHALLTMEHLLSNLQPGFLGPHIEPLRVRIRMLLDSGDHSAEEVSKRIRVLHMAARPFNPAHFETLSTGLLGRHRLRIHHYNRRTDETVQREVSPLRLIYYRDNWYLDAWCHLRNGLRSFSVDVIKKAELLNKKARNVADWHLDEVLGAGYGIFSGKKTRKAVLRFTPARARWVSAEEWHPEQESRFDEQGHYVLTVPYSDDTELMMDILRYGSDVEVLRPKDLRKKIQESAAMTCVLYSD